MDNNQLTCIFCDVDDFCREFERYTQGKLLPFASKGKSGSACRLSDSEITTLSMAFQSSGFRNFKTFYVGFLIVYWKIAFPNLPSYQRFIEIIRRVIFDLILFAQLNSGRRTGIYYIDSTCLPVRHLKRSKKHKTFEIIARYGHAPAGWFFELKLHLVTSVRGSR